MKTNFRRLNCGFIALILLMLSLGACKKDKPAPTPTPPPAAQVVTKEIKGATATEATCDVEITNFADAAILETGLVWSSTEINPTIDMNEGVTKNGKDAGAFTSAFANLLSNKTYYVRAYATNASGTSYGEVKSFVIDMDYNLYHTIKIGTQIWMLENLKTSQLSDHTGILYEQTGEWLAGAQARMCWYSNQSLSNKYIYGGLYNWYAANNADIAPAGWHVPTKADWDQLITTVNNGDALNAGIVLKEATDVNTSSPWNSFNGISSTNISGFTALPGGYRRNDNGNYDKMNYYGHFWIAGEDAVNNTISYVRLDYDSNEFHTYVVGSMVNNSPSKNYGFSVRCIKDTP